MVDGNYGYNIDDEIQNFIPKITVMGVGGAGCNAVNNMIEQGLDGVDFIAANTDAQSLMQSKAVKKIQVGRKITQGFGAGSRPEVGQKAAEESANEIADMIKNTNILFLTAGMGGGTGSGALPVIAKIAKEKNILTVAIVTTPFDFEGPNKAKIANAAIERLIPNVDSYVILPNQNLYNLNEKQLNFFNAFKYSDGVLYDGVKNITDLIRIPGTINLDFADIRAVMSNGGKTIIGTAVFEGDNRALNAVDEVISNPMLKGSSVCGARSVLVNITANPQNLSLEEPALIMNTIRSSINSDDTNFYLGTCFDESMGDKLKVAIIATGLSKEKENFDYVPYTSGMQVMSDVNVEKNLLDEDDVAVKDEEPVHITETTFSDEEELNNVVRENQGFSQENQKSDFDLNDFGLDNFLNETVKETEEKTEPVLTDTLVKKDEKKSDDDPDDDPNNPNGGKKSHDLSSFFDMLEDGNDDSFFSDVDNYDGKDSKMKADDDLQINPVKKDGNREEDNVVFLSGSLDKDKSESKQTDFMDMFQKMKETLDLPVFMKKK